MARGWHGTAPGGKLAQTREGQMRDQVFTFQDFQLESGSVLPEVSIAYVTRGTLDPDGRNAILVTHGYTSSHRMIVPGGASSEGAWSTLVGPGAPIDTDRYFVVCSNMLGSSYGSTNAASIVPMGGDVPGLHGRDRAGRDVPAAAGV